MSEDSPGVEEKAEEKLNPQVTVEDAGPCKKRMGIEIAADRVASEMDKAYRELIGAAEVPGFRKGHVPRTLAEKRFGKQVSQEVGERLSSAAFVEAVESNGFDVIGRPEFGEVKIEGGLPLKFEATVYLKPAVAYDDYKAVALRKKSAEVTDKDIEERIDQVRKARAPLAPVDRPAQAGDQATFDFKLASDGKELRAAEDARLFVEGDSFLGLKVESLEKVFAGRKNGDEFELDATLPENFREEEYRGKPAKISVKMKEIKAPQTPEANDEWAKSLDFDDMEDLRDEFKSMLRREKTAAVQADLQEQVRAQLREKADFELPEELVAQQAESVFVRKRMEMENIGIPTEEIDKRIEKLREAERDSTRGAFKLYFMLQHVAEKEKIFVTEDEVDARLSAIALRRGTSAAELRTVYEQNDIMGELRTEMREEKTIQFIIDRASVTEEKA